MRPIHQAAWHGDVAAIDRLVAQDGKRLNVRYQVDLRIEALGFRGCTPLMLAAYRGQDAAVARLLALGADVGLKSTFGWLPTHWACYGNQPSSLALLLGAGASVNARSNHGLTPLMAAAVQGASDCVTLLVARGGDGVNAQQDDGFTALHMADYSGHCQAVSLLLHAGADPTIRTNRGLTALETAQAKGHQQCVAILQAALAEAQRPRALFKAHALLDAVHKHRQILLGNDDYNMQQDDELQRGPPPRRTRAETSRRLVAGASAYLKNRVQRGDPLPHVQVVEQGEEAADETQELVAACVKYALGLEGGGGVVPEGQEPAVGMLPDVFVELLELLVPKWDPARKGRPLGDDV